MISTDHREFSCYVGYSWHKPIDDEVRQMRERFLAQASQHSLEHPLKKENLRIRIDEPDPDYRHKLWTIGWKYKDKP